MLIPLRSILACVLSVALSGGAWATQPQWPAPPSRLVLATPNGTLHVRTSEYIYESKLLIDGVDIEPRIEGLLNIPYAFSMPNEHIALVSINTGQNSCPVAYRWVVLGKKGYKVSRAFGSCSEHIEVSAKKRVFTLKTPNIQKPDKIDLYEYDGKTIKHRTVSKTLNDHAKVVPK